MRYIFMAIIVFLLRVGLSLYFGAGLYLVKQFQHPKKMLHASVRPTVVPRDDMRSFRGDISKLTETGFVVKNRDGSANVMITESTTFVGGEREELVEGKEVVVSGKVDKKGIITANVIESGHAIGKPFIKK